MLKEGLATCQQAWTMMQDEETKKEYGETLEIITGKIMLL